jgi:hypothetical protein
MKEDSAKQEEYAEKTQSYDSSIEQLLKDTQDVEAALKQGGIPDPEFMKIKLSITMLTIVANYLVKNKIYVAVFGKINENLLTEARKSMHKCLVYLEEVVTNIIDAPFSDYAEGLAKIAAVSPAQRYSLVEKIGQQMTNLKEAFGKDSKWKWTFVELEGRYATIAKNLINLRDYFVNSDFESPHYEPTVRHIRKASELLEQAADGYRKKYELSSKAIDDFQKGINYLSALKRLYIFTGDQESAVTAKKKIETWTAKMTADAEKQKKEAASRR